MLYGGAVVTAFLSCLYLLLSKVNVIAPGTTPSARLRHWAAAFFGVAVLGHLWWYFFGILSGDASSWAYMACVVLDCVSMLTTIFGTTLSMLQDRKRPLWPFVAATMPIAILGGLQIARPGSDFLTPALVYMLAIYVFFTIYMVVAVRQYGRWLRDNYADLEHKEVWLSHTLLILFLLLVAIYGFSSDSLSLFLLRIADFVLFGLLLWRVETLPQLEAAATDEEGSPDSLISDPSPIEKGVDTSLNDNSTDISNHSALSKRGDEGKALSNIGNLLKDNCEKTGLYLMNDLTLAQLSAAVGVNRTYLSHYFSTQGMNYNAYINGLRINHFVGLYQKAVANQQHFTAQQLAQECGYRSYSTFATAFKQRMGQSVASWVSDLQSHYST